ncbi:ABC transporter substrate-binding protein [Ferruginivarius sediminum]|uniref:Peptide ABC transporter substrate-binding protein n=1 Tax=Ferruginivarius sediminum TaxID=2661937 RepID=A0A369T9V7_9PROT|nr:ABC transporter substrate-binding protein [Ferruginivarius sediminum]RDD60957.1 peptide ABC transporter substrate-binding protein [Ferruginivarius sediminum]
MAEIDRLKNLLSKGIISRREFMVAAAAAGISASSASLIVPSPAYAAPKRGGHFQLGLGAGSTTDSLDPGRYLDIYMQTVGHSLHNFLTEVTEDGELVGELAESWEASSDATEWTFKLRKGVTFHNGKPLEAEDVVASFNHHRGEDSQSAAKGIVDPIKDIRADGKDTVVFTLEAGNADFSYITSDYHLPIMPSKDGKVDATSGVGCGGYVLKKFDPGVETVVERNPDYWKDDRAWFDQITFVAIKDVAARTNALRTGQIHAMDRADLKTINLLERDPSLNILSVTGSQIYTVPMITTAEPFNDNNVRLALKHAVDRQELVDKILQGYGRVGNDQPIGPSYRYHADLPQREYDPEKAKHYLKKAGMDSLTVNLSASDAAFVGAVDAAVLYKEHAAKAGININVVREPSDGYWENVWMKKPWCMCYWSGRATADWMFSIAYAEDANWNDTDWKHDRFNKLLKEARSELDGNKRAEMYAEMQTIVRDEGGVALPVFADYVNAAAKNVATGKIGNNWDMDGLRVAERWWFKDA